MKIYILGINGMLGSELFYRFNKNTKINTRGCTRSAYINNFSAFHNKIDYNVSAYELKKIKNKIKIFKPNYVINCIGLIKQKINKFVKFSEVFYINSIFPKEIYKITKLLNIKLIHFSTDCVFDGKIGNYNENSMPNATDLYGFSKYLGEKYLGELKGNKVITFRTSIIGHEMSSGHGLLEWFLSKKKCLGYTHSFFSGFTTFEIFNFINKYINIKNQKVFGLYNLSSSKISKYSLLKIIAKIYNKKILIKKDSTVRLNRVLNSSLIKKKLSYHSPSWKKMITDMNKNKISFFN
jgi:dTDP-4-dehydrorhamnose reductase